MIIWEENTGNLRSIFGCMNNLYYVVSLMTKTIHTVHTQFDARCHLCSPKHSQDRPWYRVGSSSEYYLVWCHNLLQNKGTRRQLWFITWLISLIQGWRYYVAKFSEIFDMNHKKPQIYSVTYNLPTFKKTILNQKFEAQILYPNIHILLFQMCAFYYHLYVRKKEMSENGWYIRPSV